MKWRNTYAKFINRYISVFHKFFEFIDFQAKIQTTWYLILFCVFKEPDRLCGLVVRVSGYRSRGSEFDSRLYQIFWEVVGLQRGPLSLVRIIEELLQRKSSGSGQENRINDRGDPLSWPRDTLYPQKLALTSPTSDGRSVGWYSSLAD
jgi:hypothetical protein